MRRGPLDRAEAQRWQLQEFANRHPSEKEIVVRQALAAVLELIDPPERPAAP